MRPLSAPGGRKQRSTLPHMTQPNPIEYAGGPRAGAPIRGGLCRGRGCHPWIRRRSPASLPSPSPPPSRRIAPVSSLAARGALTHLPPCPSGAAKRLHCHVFALCLPGCASPPFLARSWPYWQPPLQSQIASPASVCACVRVCVCACVRVRMSVVGACPCFHRRGTSAPTWVANVPARLPSP